MTATLVLSVDEAVELIRKHLQLMKSIDIAIDVDGSQNSNRWIDVPVNWSINQPPPQAAEYAEIDVIYDDLSIDSGRPSDWSWNWVQADIQFPVVIRKFRPKLTSLVADHVVPWYNHGSSR